MGYIYKIFTSCSNKVYIGQTRQSIEDRYKEHLKNCSAGVPYHLYNAMRKYGIENFYVEEIEECDNDVLSEREQYWIQYYDSFHNGYNMTIGGKGNSLYNYKDIVNKYLELENEKRVAEYFNCSCTTVKKACENYNIKIKRNVQQKGFWNTEQGQIRKEKMRQRWIENNPSKNGMSESHKRALRNNSWMAQPVKCIETGAVYPSAAEAGRQMGLKSGQTITRCCKGLNSISRGYHWEFVRKVDING